jgi:hypothetical protein
MLVDLIPATNTCIIDQDIDLPKCLYCQAYQSIDIRRVRHIRLDSQAIPANLLHCRDGLIKMIRSPATNHHLGILPRQSDSNTAPDARSTSGNDGNLLL